MAKETMVASTVPQVNRADRKSPRSTNGTLVTTRDVTLPDEEGQERDRADHETRHGTSARPALLAGLDHPVGDSHQAEARQDDAEPVKPGGSGAAGLGHQDRDCHEGRRHKGNVDEEHRPPPEVVEQPTAEHGTERVAEHGATHDHCCRLLSFRVGGEEHCQDRERDRHDHRGTSTEQGPDGDEGNRGAGVGAPGRACSEHAQGDEQEPLAAVAVGQEPCGKQQAGEHEAVGVDEPLKLARGGMQGARQGGQRHVQHGQVDADHQNGDRERDQRPPASGGAARLSRRTALPGSLHYLTVSLIKER